MTLLDKIRKCSIQISRQTSKYEGIVYSDTNTIHFRYSNGPNRSFLMLFEYQTADYLKTDKNGSHFKWSVFKWSARPLENQIFDLNWPPFWLVFKWSVLWLYKALKTEPFEFSDFECN